MRRAIDLVHYVVKDGIMHTANDHANSGSANNSSPFNRSKEVKYRTFLLWYWKNL